MDIWLASVGKGEKDTVPQEESATFDTGRDAGGSETLIPQPSWSKPVASPAQEGDLHSTALRGSRRPTILIIEDDGSTREVVRLSCTGQYLNLVEADTGEKDLQLLHPAHPDFAPPDLNFPRTTAFTVSRHILPPA